LVVNGGTSQKRRAVSLPAIVPHWPTSCQSVPSADICLSMLTAASGAAPGVEGSASLPDPAISGKTG
jgi:hypothetical protein